ncbi:hypothetical protein [Mycobacterium sp. NAZ190054]|uniref:hypothetical protein n=1 Tax=Mycobacterium sp. NAZ190054 TaxID=1747766 RepID=UPI000791A90C|nr:hypothetical protein [Mycobacterium sp. NAZ190054]KWX66830.1 hypothetical protein ASJ79_05550 [Mycobacterium sp. NAZ190054]
MTLTHDQRWLLMTMGGWQIVDALIGPGGVNHLMQSQWGGSRLQPIPGAPGWMTSFQTRGSKIVSPSFADEPRVTVTAAQINAYARALPSGVRGELEELALQRQQHAWQGRDWCLCGRAEECRRRNQGDPVYGDRHHPTEAEENQRHADWLRMRITERVLLAKALGLNAREEPVQLDLFEAAS